MLADYLTMPAVIVSIGIATVIVLMAAFRVHAFLALIAAAVVVSFLAPPPVVKEGEKVPFGIELGKAQTAEFTSEAPQPIAGTTKLPFAEAAAMRVTRVLQAFGDTAGKIGLVIGLASIIGKCLMDSGAADKIVRFFLHLVGEKRAATALMGSGFVLAIPVFFDTVFYLLVPLARSLFRRTRTDYVKYTVAIAAGGAITHTLVPPTPGPLVLANSFNVEIGTMLVIGTMVAAVSAVAGLIFANLANRWYPAEPQLLSPTEEEMVPIAEDRLPGLFLSALPILLPVIMITADTVLGTVITRKLVDGELLESLKRLQPTVQIIGSPFFALALATLIAMAVLKIQRKMSLHELSEQVEEALLSAGVIILITAAGGAFGEMLRQSNLRALFVSEAGPGSISPMALMWLGFLISAVLKIAQGSSTVAMITTGSILGPLVTGETAIPLPFHTVYLALAIGSGSLIGSWMNDSGFWVFARMSGFSEGQALRTWTVLLIILGVTGMLTTLLLATILPMAPAVGG